MATTRNKRDGRHASIRTLWAIAKSEELGLSEEDLHAVVYRETGKESLRKLNQGELNTIARILQNMKDGAKCDVHAKRIDKGGNEFTESQRRKIYALCEVLGWNDDPKRLQGFVKRVTHVDRVEWLTAGQCNNVIEGLKNMIARQEKRKEKQMKIYVASSWRNDEQNHVVKALRSNGYEVYDFKNPIPENNGFHWSEIDPKWQDWTAEQFRDQLSHPIANHGFSFDMAALENCEVCVLVLPCGRSAHLEAGYAMGARKPTIILLENGEPELMYKMTPYICLDIHEVLVTLEEISRIPPKIVTHEEPDH